MSAGGAHGRGRRGGGGHDEGGHDGPDERWLVSYADMITVLMALFIVLFAISQVDAQKFLQLKQGLAEGVGASSSIPVDGGSGLLVSNGSIAAPAQPQTAVQAESVDVSAAGQGASSSAGGGASAMQAAREEVERLDELQRQLDASLQSGGLGDRVDFRITERGLVGAIVADDVFFESSSAALRETGRAVLDAMAPVLDADQHPLELQGHTNSLPVRGGLYPSNWELSAARAASVVRHLESDGVASDRMTAVGYGQTRPLYPGNDEQALSGNRRVDLVVLSDQPAEVKALLPEAAAEAAASAAPPEPQVAPAAVALAPPVEASAADHADAGGH
ncbi:flagellar motor protein MotB [Pseudokineococcus marinus]|uniref:OmpA family protein n=1 Tax=Pseudokineococcus marinus TaxID=351215 RepID=A0A849BKN4_9ACTN|nr:flagellar motor protein MotB [Pseudokineococcus marinus]NNH23760.1 OmpA family protein [Pseudokineococcus marinus]